jgi:hypothetical protein
VDMCPDTPKYLEVHYRCIGQDSNRKIFYLLCICEIDEELDQTIFLTEAKFLCSIYSLNYPNQEPIL